MKRFFLVVLALAAASCDLDLSHGHPYPCSPDAGDAQCPGQWHCGVEGICTDPTVAAPNRCQTQADCGGGWHCGVNGVCYDVTDAGAIACRSDAGDCAPGWRCGLEQVCHDQDAGAAYLCATDTDCSQGWRCGPNNVCVDATLDALRPVPDPSALGLRRLNPLLDDLPSLASVSHSRQYALADGGSFYGFSAAFLVDAGVWFAETAFGRPSSQPFAAWVPVGRPSALAAVGPTLYGLDDAGLWRYQIGGAPARLVSGQRFPSGDLRIGDDAFRDQPLLFELDDAGFTVIDPVALWATPHVAVRGDAGAIEPILDLTESLASWDGLLIATTDGLFYSAASSSFLAPDGGYGATIVPINPSALPNAQCGLDAGWVPVRVRSSDYRVGNTYQPGDVATAFAVEVVPRNQPDARHQVVVFGQNVDTPSVCGNLGVPAFGPLDLCVDAGTLVDFFWLDGFSYNYFGGFRYGTQLESRCHAAGADSTFLTTVDLSAGPVLYEDTGRYGYYPNDVLAVRSRSTRDGEFVNTRNLALSRSSGIVYSPLTLASRASVAFGSLADGMLVRGQQQVQWDPIGGLVQSSYPEFCTPVRGEPLWSMQCSGNGGDQHVIAWRAPGLPTVATLNVSSTLQESDVALAIPIDLRLADGGEQLLVAASDTIWGGDVSRLSPLDAGAPVSGAVAVLQPRATPEPLQPIQAFAVAGSDVDAGAALFLGYALVNNKVFQIRAADPVLWTSGRVTLPVLDPISLWTDGSRGRVLYGDGTVYALPSRVQIAQPISTGSIDQFATLCGGGYALSGGAIYQLAPVADGGLLGEWRPVPIQSAVPPYVASTSISSLLPVTNALLAVTDFGETYVLQDSCDGGAP